VSAGLRVPRIALLAQIIEPAVRECLENKGCAIYREAMSLAKARRFSRALQGPLSPARWPRGISLRPFVPEASAQAVHRLLVEGYANGGGSVADFRIWWDSLAADDEYDPELVFTAFDDAGRLAGVAHCWTSAFVKDLVVSPSHRRRGLGSSLLQHAFAIFRSRGANAVDLKVEADNFAAISLYRSVGMEEQGS
jgi:GNAT superfamily N-acetyltransferase